MKFSVLNINLNQQACSHAFQGNFESLKNWGNRIFQVMQNHPYALHKHSPQVISGVLLTINGLFFLTMRSFANAIEASLNKRFPNIPTIHLMISSALLGGTVGSLNLALFKLARLPASVDLLYAISIASVALHLILKPPTLSSTNKTLLPSHPLSPPISTRPSDQPKPPLLHAQVPPQPPIFQPPRHQQGFPEAEKQPKSLLTQQPPERPPSADFLTPMPSPPHLKQFHTPTFSPRNPSKAPTTPATIPPLNVKDVEEVEIKVLEELNRLEIEKNKYLGFSNRYEILIQQLHVKHRTELRNRDGFASSQTSAKLLEAQEGLAKAKELAHNLDNKIAEQRQLLENIRLKKNKASLSETRSGPGTPAAKFRQHLLQAASSHNEIQEPFGLRSRMTALELDQTLNSPEREENLSGDQPPPYELTPEPIATEDTLHNDRQIFSVSGIFYNDEQPNEDIVFNDSDFEYEDEEGNVYAVFELYGKEYLVDQAAECFDRSGNYMGNLVERTFGSDFNENLS
jgi:hypothetical protein